MQRGFCNHPQKNCRIVTEWKCVDILYPSDISAEERTRRQAECRKKNFFGVCEFCRFFKPDPGTESVKASGVAEKPSKPDAYTDIDEMYL